MKKDMDWLKDLLHSEYIPAQDIPDIGLYMDQVTTFMESKLESSKRYPDDKIMTKTMINNYTKNRLIPPSIKKKYSRDHMFFIIIIYYLKTMLSISDIKQLLTPLAEKYFPENKENGISLEQIYSHNMMVNEERLEDIRQEIMKLYEMSRKDDNLNRTRQVSDQDREWLNDFAFICSLSYDIYIRKKIVEKLIDLHMEQTPPGTKNKKKK